MTTKKIQFFRRGILQCLFLCTHAQEFWRVCWIHGTLQRVTRVSWSGLNMQLKVQKLMFKNYSK